ncbi:hypothetical protein Tco_0307237 [Tanacetum coccineum]
MLSCEHHAKITVMVDTILDTMSLIQSQVTEDRGCVLLYCGWMTISHHIRILESRVLHNCKFLAEKIKTLEGKDKDTRLSHLEMENASPEKHTLDSAAILHRAL